MALVSEGQGMNTQRATGVRRKPQARMTTQKSRKQMSIDMRRAALMRFK
jgi:hypothetical protein